MDRNVEKETVVLLGLDIVQMGICWSCWSVLGGVGWWRVVWAADSDPRLVEIDALGYRIGRCIAFC